MKKILVILFVSLNMCFAQTKPDTVVIKVGTGSKVVVSIKDKKDLETLKRYDFQAIMNDMISKLERRDTTKALKSSSYLKDTTKIVIPVEEKIVTKTEEPEAEDWSTSKRKYRGRRTYNSFNFDLGTNNYLSDGKFPDEDNSPYTVRPWGSWYISFNSTYRTRLAKKFFLEWGTGVSWYNFKFQNNSLLVSKDNSGITFSEDLRDISFKKSKLTASYINASVVPMLDFGSNRRKGGFFTDFGSHGFRIGAGAYAGYRIGSYAKQVYKENGDRDSDKNRSNFYMNNFRYGLRAQIGYNDVDFFFNYDLNELFAENKGPQLNAFSFGISF